MRHIRKFKFGQGELTLVPHQHFIAIQKGINQQEIQQQPHKNIGNFSIYFSQSIDQSIQKLPVYQIAGEQTMVVSTGDLYVEFNKKTTQAAIKAFLKKNELTIVEEVFDKSFIVNTSQNTDAIELAAIFQKKEKHILNVAEPDLIADAAQYEFTLPTDELLSKQWYLENGGLDPNGKEEHWKYRQGADAKVLEAWKILHEHKGYISSENITIAVVDKGFDLTHPDFDGKIVAERDFNHEANPHHGEPFPVAENDVSKTGQIYTEADHGTSCAGIALAASNGMGIVGVAPNSKFMPIRYFVANGRYMRKMFRHIIANGGDVASCSFGNIGLPMDRLTIRTLRYAATKGRNGKGLVIAFATGNAYDFLTQNEIATHPDIIAVGATTSEDTFAPYTNRTTNMSVVAPGGYGHSGTLTTTDVGFLDELSESGELVSAGRGNEDNPYYRSNAEGTSFACPVVAGVAALVLSANPDLTAKEVKSILETTADKVGDAGNYNEHGHSPKFGYGRVNAANAVRKALGLPLENYQTESPVVDHIPQFEFDYGTTIEAMHEDTSEELVIKYTLTEADAGKQVLVELEVGLDHNPNYEFELYVQKGRKPVYFPEDFIDKHLGEMPKLKLENTEAGEYYFMVRCIDKKEWEYIKGGGKFELTFTLSETQIT